MKRNLWLIPVVVLASGLAVSVAIGQSGPGKTRQATTDTVPERKKIKDIDDALEELQKSRAEVDRSLREIDVEKLQKEIEASLKHADINMEQIRANVEKAMKNLDAQKIQLDIEKAMKEVDAVKIKAEVEKALKEVDVAKIQAEVQASIARIDWEKMQAQVEKIRTEEMPKIEEQLKKMGPQIEKSMAEAHASMEKATKELQEYKSFIGALEKDGLIQKDQPYTIEYKNGELTINGKKQPASVTEKYPFLKNKKDFTIEKSRDDFNIHNN